MLRRWSLQGACTEAELTVMPRFCSHSRKSVVVVPCLIVPADLIEPVSYRIRSVTVVLPGTVRKYHL